MIHKINKILKEDNLPHPRFLEFKAEYKKAAYCFNPILFEREDKYIKGSKMGPQAILQASHQIEKYHIPTDSKPYLSGFYTKEAYFSPSEEDQIDVVNKTVTKQIEDGKIPITLLADGSGSIGAYYALNKAGKEVTVINLDAHLSLRDTMQGTRYHRLCKMHHAKVCSKNVLHVGISSMGNTEKEKYDPDKIFFAEDIWEDKYWLEDIIAEVGNNSYISLDMSVFDQAVINSDNPSVNGLTYRHIQKLLRELVKETTIVGIDLSGFAPNTQNKDQQIALSQLLYDVIGHIEMKR